MRTFFFASLVVMTTVGVALAQTSDIFTANTVRTVSAGDGAILDWMLNSDGTYTTRDAQGRTTHGAYSSNATQFCTTPDGGEQSCVPAAPANLHVGDSWTIQDEHGRRFTATVIAGRH